MSPSSNYQRVTLLLVILVHDVFLFKGSQLLLVSHVQIIKELHSEGVLGDITLYNWCNKPIFGLI